MDTYFDETKKRLEENIPDYDTPEFKKMRDKIKKELSKKENDFLILIRKLKILVLGDWFNEQKRALLTGIKTNLLRSGLYAETIDKYYDMNKKDGLSQIQIFESCCINHQLIVFIDGEGAGTITEQNYLREYYALMGKVLFFIKESKFNELKNNPNEYIKDFPTIIEYKNEEELLEKTLVYSRFRLYRLASIIQKQLSTGTGMYGIDYVPWRDRLKKVMGKGFKR